MSFALPNLYPITDTRLSGMSHARQIELMAAGGAMLIQIRDKTVSPRMFYEATIEAVGVARKVGVRVIINDRVDIAIAVGADGVHLGQDDLPAIEARRLLGVERIVGVSTHNLEQALAASSLPVDYIAVGPIFGTSTKEKPDPEVGLGLIKEIRMRAGLPLVGIGGITLDRAASVFAAGATSVAVISDILLARDIPRRVREFMSLGPQRVPEERNNR